MGSNQNANSSFACLHWQHCQDRMQRPNHISVSKIETMMMTVDITDCESCPDFFLLWRGEGREQKKDNSIRGYPFVKYGACAKYSLFPTKKSKSQPSLLLSKMFNIATFFSGFFDGFIFCFYVKRKKKFLWSLRISSVWCQFVISQLQSQTILVTPGGSLG